MSSLEDTGKDCYANEANEFKEKEEFSEVENTNEANKIEEKKEFLEVKNGIATDINSKVDLSFLKPWFESQNEDNLNFKLLKDKILGINDNDLRNEIKRLMNINELSNDISDDIIKKLEKLNNISYVIKNLNNMIFLFNIFNIKMGDLSEKISEIIYSYEFIQSFDTLSKIEEEIKALNLNFINLQKFSRTQKTIDSMCNYPEFTTFFVSKNITNMDQMKEFIFSNNPKLLSEEIDQLNSCLSFILDLKRDWSELTEKEFLVLISNLIEQYNYDNMKDLFKKFSMKFHKFYIEYISEIYRRSTFDIKLSYPYSQCSINYKYNFMSIKKDFDQFMLDLIDFNILERSHNINKDDLKMYRNVKELCDTIMNILSYLTEINPFDSYGFIKELNYIITIKDGKISGYHTKDGYSNESKSVSEIIEELELLKFEDFESDSEVTYDDELLKSEDFKSDSEDINNKLLKSEDFESDSEDINNKLLKSEDHESDSEDINNKLLKSEDHESDSEVTFNELLELLKSEDFE